MIMDIRAYWNSVLEQNAGEMKKYFCKDAYINWHNTNERFNVDEFIRANCEYPGSWCGEIERLEQFGDIIIAAVAVKSKDENCSFHVVSFIKLHKDLIESIDEYWGDDGPIPNWRSDMGIGGPIIKKIII